MSRRNGQRARYQINRKRKIQKRARMRAILMAGSGSPAAASPEAKTEN